MPYANNQGVRIRYEVEGEGPPLLLQHGMGASLEFWRMTGYVDALKRDYQLILVDPRGHGASEKPHTPEAYTMALRVADIVAVLDELGISQAHYCGYSLSGWTGWGIARYAPERFRSLILGGACPLGHAPEGVNLYETCQQGMEATLAALKAMFGARWSPEVRAMFAANDLQALMALMSARENWGLREILETSDLPCLLFGGELDAWFAGAEACATQMRNATAVSLPGLDHIEVQFRPELVLPHILAFLRRVDASS